MRRCCAGNKLTSLSDLRNGVLRFPLRLKYPKGRHGFGGLIDVMEVVIAEKVDTLWCELQFGGVLEFVGGKGVTRITWAQETKGWLDDSWDGKLEVCERGGRRGRIRASEGDTIRASLSGRSAKRRRLAGCSPIK